MPCIILNVIYLTLKSWFWFQMITWPSGVGFERFLNHCDREIESYVSAGLITEVRQRWVGFLINWIALYLIANMDNNLFNIALYLIANVACILEYGVQWHWHACYGMKFIMIDMNMIGVCYLILYIYIYVWYAWLRQLCGYCIRIQGNEQVLIGGIIPYMKWCD